MSYTEQQSFSPNKMLARAKAYSSLKKKIWDGKHIVLAGEGCRDIHFLLDVGVSSKDIIACDLNETAYKNANQLLKLHTQYFPNVFHESVVSVIRWAVEHYGVEGIRSINLDLCGTLRQGIPVLQEVEALFPNEKPQMFFTFLRGMKDGINGDDVRRSLLHSSSQQGWELHAYQSFHQAGGVLKQGSPMCLAISCERHDEEEGLTALHVLRWIEARSQRKTFTLTTSAVAAHFSIPLNRSAALMAILSRRGCIKRLPTGGYLLT